MTSTATPQTALPARGRTRAPQGDGPGPFPVVVVRPATMTLPSYLRRHRRRQRAANQLAADLTDQCRTDIDPRHRVADGIGVNLDDPYDYLVWLPDRQVVCDIIRQARVLAAAAPPGAVRIGRDRWARPVVAVLHAPQWSLVLRRARPYPAVWAYHAADGCGLCFYGTRELSIEWDEMTRDVYTTLTGDTG